LKLSEREPPKDWSEVKLRRVAELNPVKSKVDDIGDDTLVSFVEMEDIRTRGGLDTSESRALGEVYGGYTYFEEGDVLVAKITPCFENGKGGLATDLRNGVGFGTTELHVLRPKEALASRFLEYTTRSHPFRVKGEKQMTGAAGQQRVPEEFVADLEIPIPPKRRQEEIADFLDRKTAAIDELIDKKRRLIELLEEKRDAVINRAVTKGLDPDVEMKDSGVPWIGEIPEDWALVRLKHLTKPTTSISYGIVQPGEHVEDGKPFIQSTNIPGGEIETSSLQKVAPEIEAQYSRSRLKTGDVILGIRASIGDAHVVPDSLEGVNLSRGIARISTSDRIGSQFLRMVLRSEVAKKFWAREKKGSTFDQISIAMVKELRIPVPPICEQKRIERNLKSKTERLNSVDASVSRQIGSLEDYRQSLITAAVTGQIDVEEYEVEAVGELESEVRN